MRTVSGEVLEQKGIVFRLNARVQSVKDSDVIYRDASRERNISYTQMPSCWLPAGVRIRLA